MKRAAELSSHSATRGFFQCLYLPSQRTVLDTRWQPYACRNRSQMAMHRSNGRCHCPWCPDCPDLIVSRQCEGEFTTSCNVLNIVGGCNDPEAFASEREGMRMRVECYEDDSHRKRDPGSRNLLQTLHINSTVA